MWKKAYENGHYERSWESRMEVNYAADNDNIISKVIILLSF